MQQANSLYIDSDKKSILRLIALVGMMGVSAYMFSTFSKKLGNEIENYFDGI